MEFLTGDPVLFANATVVAADRVFKGHVAAESGRIVEVGEGGETRSAIDFDGDYLLPGLVELHTDHLEPHYMPRPAVVWHAGSAVVAYDAQVPAAGVPSLFDSFRVGMDEF